MKCHFAIFWTANADFRGSSYFGVCAPHPHWNKQRKVNDATKVIHLMPSRIYLILSTLPTNGVNTFCNWNYPTTLTSKVWSVTIWVTIVWTNWEPFDPFTKWGFWSRPGIYSQAPPQATFSGSLASNKDAWKPRCYMQGKGSGICFFILTMLSTNP